MGRTKRRRLRGKANRKEICLDSDKNVISLTGWMKANGWRNNELQLRDFTATGRGVCSKKAAKPNETLIEVPYDLMITLSVLEKSDVKDVVIKNLKIHELLALFLILERDKGYCSNWVNYINSLPLDIPALPWFCAEDELSELSLSEFSLEIKKRKWSFEDSWERVQKSIAKSLNNRVINANSYAWGYTMVNTRAVYVDPDIVSSKCDSTITGFIVSDEPDMALCPYLDMFNHSYKASTIAKLHGGSYKLVSLDNYRKHEQIFISYGSHDNLKLMLEYGFYIPENKFDCIKFDFQLLIGYVNKLGHQVNSRQYKYLKDKMFDDKLSVSMEGLSFNLKAFYFVVLHEGCSNWNANIYSENYSKDRLMEMMSLTKQFVASMEIKEVECNDRSTIYFKNFLQYLSYFKKFRMNVVDYLSAEIAKIKSQ